MPAPESYALPAVNYTEAAAVLPMLAELYGRWRAALSLVGSQAHGARDRLIEAEIALTQLETAALAVGLRVADALGGQAPEFTSALWHGLGCGTVVTPGSDTGSPAQAPVPEMDLRAAVDVPFAAEVPPSPGAEPAPLPAALQEPAARPVAITVTPATTAALNAHFKGSPKRAAKGAATVTPPEALAALARLLGTAPAEVNTAAAMAGLLSQVEATVGDVRSWERLDRPSRRILVEAVAARIRAVQQRREVDTRGQAQEKVDRQAARLMQTLAAQHGPGKLDRFAYGPASTHLPRGGSWLVDARTLDAEIAQVLGTGGPDGAEATRTDLVGQSVAQPSVDELFRRLRQDICQLDTQALVARLRALLQLKIGADDKRFTKVLEPRLGELSGVAGLTRLVRHVLERLAAQDPDDVDAPAVIGPDWPGLAHTRGKRAIIVGGDGRVRRKDVLKNALGFASLEWADLPKKSPGRTSSLVQKVRQGSFDLVICLQKFISHSITDQLFGLAVPGVTTVLAKGYGLLQVKLALDRFLPQPVAGC